MGAVPGCKSIINSISLSGGIPGKSSVKTSGYSHTTGMSSSLDPFYGINARIDIFPLWKI
jgi:hypothetical protein